MSGGTRPLLVWFAGVHWDALRGTDRHLVTALSRHADVVWVDPALSVVRRFRPSPHLARPAEPREGGDHAPRRHPDHGPGAALQSRPGSESGRPHRRRAVRRAVRREERASGRTAAAMVVAVPDPVGRTSRVCRWSSSATDQLRHRGRLLGPTPTGSPRRRTRSWLARRCWSA